MLKRLKRVTLSCQGIKKKEEKNLNFDVWVLKDAKY